MFNKSNLKMLFNCSFFDDLNLLLSLTNIIKVFEVFIDILYLHLKKADILEENALFFPPEFVVQR